MLSGLPIKTNLEEVYKYLRRGTRRMILVDEADRFVVHEAATG